MRAVATSGGLNRPRHRLKPTLEMMVSGRETHGGKEFAALLVNASYQPEAVRGMIPGVGGDVIAVAKKKP